MQKVLTVPITDRGQKFTMEVQIVYEIDLMSGLHTELNNRILTKRNVYIAISDDWKDQHVALDCILTSYGHPWNISPNFKFSCDWVLFETTAPILKKIFYFFY